MDELRIYILTANCARNIIDVDLFAKHLFDALPDSGAGSFGAPDLIVFSLQEIAPIAYSFLGGSYLTPFYDAFVKAVKQATVQQWDESYVNLVKDNTGMTALMVFARAEITDKISWIDTAHVGFGVQDMGNKGAVGARLGYVAGGHPSKTVDLTFVAAHLAPMENALEQRNLDWRSIVERLVFSKQDEASKPLDGEQSSTDENTALLGEENASHHSNSNRRGLFAPNAYVFVAGDLNYRTSNDAPSKQDVSHFPRRDVDNDHPAHYSHLLKQDQLVREMRQGNSFHGLSEAPIEFPPTYKYSDEARKAARLGIDVEHAEWKWSSHRWPSWCDRVLYLDAPSRVGDQGRVKPHAYNALPLFPQSDHRPVALAVSVPLDHATSASLAARKPADRKAVTPFEIDPSWKSRRDTARRKEILVGFMAYLSLTWEGNGLLLASALGMVGAWVVLRSLWGL
ncbi:uncharacterized protein N7459_007966 [Penicillium hispanicum]|uniref:uncharacterized protein n=1 Tax=Penicillium hispanicum TaxID=1080232 RepID=UPI0025402203|nr:uncharacterized protein N7459_007966 [Penicillium hispanicum]KAJ5573539.1 hypothetical protein N7459_007966 [Penicillium hispanicum]